MKTMQICAALFAATAATAALSAGEQSTAKKENVEPAGYREQLASLRKLGGEVGLGAQRFYLFGMGDRRKLVYRDFTLKDISTGEPVWECPGAASDKIEPDAYRVDVASSGGSAAIYEDESAVWIKRSDDAAPEAVPGTQSPVRLCEFEGFPYGKVMKVLHQEILFNISDGIATPNILAYKAPFHRDAMMVAMCLEKTGNAGLLRPMYEKATEVFDMQNGERENDNIGDMLYLSGLFPDANRALREKIETAAAAATKTEGVYKYVSGRTDMRQNDGYQTKVLKLALRRNGMADDYTDAPVPGPYDDLCWFSPHSPDPSWRPSVDRDFANYPYLAWARCHYNKSPGFPVGDAEYPLSWEKWGGKADFAAMKAIDESAAEAHIAYPHAWTAAEMFLYLWDAKKPAGGEGILRISAEEYRDRMTAGWIGQIAGVCWGGPTEFKVEGGIMPESMVPEWRPETINEAFDQDDLYVEMTFMRTLEKYGLGVSIRQAGIDFANSGYRLWCANNAARDNLRSGIAPPDSSHPAFTVWPDAIDYQIEADYSGLVSPGMPRSAIELGEKFGRIMNHGDGLYAGQFVGGMYAAAFFETNVEKIVESALECIPPESAYAGMVRDMLEWHAEDPSDWEKCWGRINEKYHDIPNSLSNKYFNGGIDVKLNGAISLMGLLYGDGDPEKTIVVAMRGGYDSDCNPSTAAGPLFTSLGLAKIPGKFKSALKRNVKFSYTAYDFDSLVAVSEKLAREIIVAQGGCIEKDSSGREWFCIPRRKPVPSKFTTALNPDPPEGSRFSTGEFAKIETHLLPESMFAGDDPTIRVQKALDALYPGWETTENGPWHNAGYARTDKFFTNLGNIIVTHPPRPGVPVVLSRTMEIPAENPRLRFKVMSGDWVETDFDLEVRADGETLLATTLWGPHRGGHPQEFTLGLARFAGRTVKLELVNAPHGEWQDPPSEAAQWLDIRVLSGGE